MTLLVLDAQAEAEYIAERRAKGLDRFDEVWDGVYVMSPMPEWYHREIVSDLNTCLSTALRRQRLGRTVPGCNVSDRAEGWTENFRCPDVVVFLHTTAARFHGTHWEGGPDFAVEIVSENDHTRDKLDFYAKVRTHELLIVERKPWKLLLLRLSGDQLVEAGTSTLDQSEALDSSVIPFRFELVTRPYGPAIKITNRTDGQVAYAPEEAPPAKSQ